MYAIVKTGANQTKVNVDDIVVMNRFKKEDGKIAQIGEKVNLPVVLVVDGAKVVTDSSKLAKAVCEAEVIRLERGAKISGMKYKNKTGYKKRWGHRQELTRLKIKNIKVA